MNRSGPQNGGRYLILCFFLLCSLLILPVGAAGFDMAGARSMGMGGAFVAACDDATAVYWNPAAITQIKGVDIQAFAGGKATDRFSDVIRDLEEWDDDHEAPYSLSEMEDLRDILKRFNKEETGVFADAAAGLAIATKWVALSSVALAPANLDPYADTQLSHLGPTEANRADNTSRVDINSLVNNNIALTLASTLGIPNLALGANVKYLQAYRYTASYYLFSGRRFEFDQSREVSAGLGWWLLDRHLALRGG